MPTLNLTINTWQYYRLRASIDTELAKWELIKHEAELGLRPNASVEGADILISDTKVILDQLEMWADQNNIGA